MTITELDFRHVVELLADAVVASRGEMIVFINRSAERLLGWRREELIGLPLVTIVPERLRQAHLAGVARYRSTGVPKLLGKAVRVPALRRDGSELEIELTISALPIDNDELFVATLRDLTDLVELERTLALTDQLRVATRGAADLVARLDLDHVAQTAVTTLTTGLGAVLARLWIADDEQTTLRLRASAGISTRVDASRATIDVQTYPFKVGHVARTLVPFVTNDVSDPTQFEQAWVQAEGIRAVAVFPLRGGSELRGVVAAFFRTPLADEQVDLLHTFASMVSAATNDVHLLERLRAAIEARDHFLSMASHELNTPITTLKLQLESMARSGLDEEQVTRRLHRAQKQVARLASLVRELLDVSRIADGRLRLSRDDVDLGALVAEVADRHAVDLESAGCRMELRLAPEVRGIWDRDRIDQVITNLVSNAMKYGIGKPITVEVSLRGPRALLRVCDQGMGIAPEDQPRIFLRFERATRGGTQAGLGLGLWIAHEIVVAHGGTIMVDSDVGKGATFTVDLPAR